jgi:hypothetical protein
MKRFALALFSVFAFFVMTAVTPGGRSHDIYVNGKFLISSYSVDGKEAVAFDDLAKLVGASNLAIRSGRVMSSPPNEARGTTRLQIKKALALGNVFSSNGRQWIATPDFLKQIGGGAASAQFTRLGPGAALQIRLYDCPDVRCCPECGIAFRF